MNTLEYYKNRFIPEDIIIYEGYKIFNIFFEKDYNKLLNGSLFFGGSYCIAPISLMDKEQMQILENNFLKEKGLFCGKVQISEPILNHEEKDKQQQFLSDLSLLFFKHLCQYGDIIHQHLSIRTIASEKLINNDAIRMQLADFYILLEKCPPLIKENCFHASADLMLQAFAQLGKLAGGRAFLANNIFELQSLLFLFNDIYFKEVFHEKI